MLLLDAAFYATIPQFEVIKLNDDRLLLQSTTLGWLAMETVPERAVDRTFSPETDFDDYICPAEEDSLCFLTIINAEPPTRSTTCYSSGPPACSAAAEQRDQAVRGGGDERISERIDHHMRTQFAHPFYLLAWVRRSPRCGVMGKHLGSSLGS